MAELYFPRGITATTQNLIFSIFFFFLTGIKLTFCFSFDAEDTGKLWRIIYVGLKELWGRR